MKIIPLEVKYGTIKVNNESSVGLNNFITANTSNSVFKRQVIRYKLNSNGQINGIETVDTANDGSRDGLYNLTSSTANLTYRADQKSLKIKSFFLIIR